MSERSTCGQGLAENAALPAGLAQVTEAMAGMLERHMAALDLTDPHSTAEHAVYGELAAAHRRIADQLRAAADRMDAQRDLPMGLHDMAAITHPATVPAFQNVVDAKRHRAQRRRKVKPPLDSYTLRLLSKQDARCTLCGDDLLTFEDPPQTPQGWEWWYLWVTKKAIAADYLVHHDQPGRSRDQRTYLVHTHCSRMKHPVRAAAGTAM